MKLNKFTTILGIAVFTMALATPSVAQTAGPAGGVPAPATTHVKNRHPLRTALAQVNLTADQKTKAFQILATRDHNDKAFHKAHKGDLLAIKANRKTQNKAALDSLKGVLSTTQWQQLTTLLHHGKKGNKAPATPPTAA